MKCKPWIRHFQPQKFQCFSSTQFALHGLRALEKSLRGSVRWVWNLGIGNSVGRQGRGNQPPYRRYGPDMEIQYRLRRTSKNQQNSLQKGSRSGISVSTPHRRYGHRLRTPFWRTPFPRLLSLEKVSNRHFSRLFWTTHRTGESEPRPTSGPTSGPTNGSTSGPTSPPTRAPTRADFPVSALQGLPTKHPTNVSTEGPTVDHFSRLFGDAEAGGPGRLVSDSFFFDFEPGGPEILLSPVAAV